MADGWRHRQTSRDCDSKTCFWNWRLNCLRRLLQDQYEKASESIKGFKVHRRDVWFGWKVSGRLVLKFLDGMKALRSAWLTCISFPLGHQNEYLSILATLLIPQGNWIVEPFPNHHLNVLHYHDEGFLRSSEHEMLRVHKKSAPKHQKDPKDLWGPNWIYGENFLAWQKLG